MNVSRKLTLLLLALLPFTVSAQSDDGETGIAGFDEFRKSLLDDFNTARSQILDDYNDFREQIMADYVEFVRQAWREFECEPPLPAPKDIPIPPVVIPREDRVKPVEERKVPIDEVILPLMLTPQPEPVFKIKEIPALHEDYVYFTLFGTDVKARFNPADKVVVTGTDENTIADAIQAMDANKYDNTLLDCLSIREGLKLSDWAYLQLIDALAEKIYGKDENSAALFTMYMYMMSGYKVRVGTDGDRLYMMFACEELIYNGMRFMVDGTLFYGIDDLPARMHICEASFEKEQELSLVLKSGQHFAYKGSEPRRIVAKDYPDVSVEVSVNENLMKFYDTYPTSHIGDNKMTRWAMYANVELDERVRNRIYPTLMAAIYGLSEVEAVNRLLNIVQTGLVYGYDSEIWGEDRVFFAEESLYYPYSDCEDRAVLFSRLVRDLLGLDVALVMVPGHMLAAVHFNDDVRGSYLTLDGRDFVLCEPTCSEGAPVGLVNLDDNAKLQVYLLEKTNYPMDFELMEETFDDADEAAGKKTDEEVEHSLIPYFDGAKWGYKNNAGEIVVKCEYDSVSDNALYGDKHMYVAQKDDKLYLYDYDGFLTIDCDDYIPLDLNEVDGAKYDFYGILKWEGEWYITDFVVMVEASKVFLNEYDMDSVTYKDNVYCRLPAGNRHMERFIIVKRKSDEKWGVINVHGKTVVPFEYDRITFTKNDKSTLLLYNARSGEEKLHKL